MYENDYMYAVERDDNALAHYGIRGMKWGVRKAIQSGNQRALGRQYRKAQRKLAKLEKRANSGAKYARRAALLGAGAAAAGGLAAAGTGGVASAMTKIGAHGGSAMIGAGRGIRNIGTRLSKDAYVVGSALQKTGHAGAGTALKKFGAHGGNAMVRAGNAMSTSGQSLSKSGYIGGKAVRNWGNSNSVLNTQAKYLDAIKYNNPAIRPGYKAGGMIANKRGVNIGMVTDRMNPDSWQSKVKGISNNTVARVGAGALGLGLAGAAGYNAYRAATTKRAAKKAAQFRSEMNKAFKGTQYDPNRGRHGKKRRR